MLRHRLYAPLALLLLAGCLSGRPDLPVDRGSVEPGSAVTRGGVPLELLGTPVAVGETLPNATLMNTRMEPVELASLKGDVLLISVVPSVDTGVCERQTHLLAEAGDILPPTVRRVTVSRDLPFAQQRFAEEAGIDEVLFLSDYRDAGFGRATGLLVDELALLARSVIVVDRQGTIRYLQVVPELSHLPDMATAFERAAVLAERP